jgi:hypothetical protein
VDWRVVSSDVVRDDLTLYLYCVSGPPNTFCLAFFQTHLFYRRITKPEINQYFSKQIALAVGSFGK